MSEAEARGLSPEAWSLKPDEHVTEMLQTPGFATENTDNTDVVRCVAARSSQT